MKDESLHPWIEPELEARIVALVVGEASDFETEELERLIEETPELGLFRSRIEAMHAMLRSNGKTESIADAADWKLSEEKRDAVLTAIGGENILPVKPGRKEVKAKGKLIWKIVSKVAAAIFILSIPAILILGSLPGIQMSYDSDSDQYDYYDVAESTKDAFGEVADAPVDAPVAMSAAVAEEREHVEANKSLRKSARVADKRRDGEDQLATGLATVVDGGTSRGRMVAVDSPELQQNEISNLSRIAGGELSVGGKVMEASPLQEEPMLLADLQSGVVDRLSLHYHSEDGLEQTRGGRILLEKEEAAEKEVLNAQSDFRRKNNELAFPTTAAVSDEEDARLSRSLSWFSRSASEVPTSSGPVSGISSGYMSDYRFGESKASPENEGRETGPANVFYSGVANGIGGAVELNSDKRVLSSLDVADGEHFDDKRSAMKLPAITAAPPATATAATGVVTAKRLEITVTESHFGMKPDAPANVGLVPGQSRAMIINGASAPLAVFGKKAPPSRTPDSGADAIDLDTAKSRRPFLKAKELVRKVPLSFNELSAKDEPFSTFSLHVSDVSFKLAQAALAKGEWPDSERIRIEEFVNAFDYGDPLPGQDEKVSAVLEQAIHPFLQQRNLLRVSMRTAETGRNASTPLRLTFLLDNSGSMERSDRRDTVRSAFAVLASMLQPADEVTLISFARQPRLLADRVAGDQAAALVETVANLPSEGGTNLEAALDLAFEKALEQQTPGAQNRIILLTDGAANLGDARPEKLATRVESMRNAGIAFDAAGIGTEGLNDEILEALTRKGDGRYYLLDRKEDVDSGFAKQIAGALRPAAGNVKIQMEFNPARVGKYKLLGFEKHRLNKEDFRNDKVDAAELAAAEAGVAVYQIETIADGDGDIGAAFVRFRDMATGKMTERRWTIPYQSHPARPEHASPSMQVATAAAMLGAKLKGGVAGDVVDLNELNQIVSQLPKAWREKPRVVELTKMIGAARSIADQ